MGLASFSAILDFAISEEKKVFEHLDSMRKSSHPARLDVIKTVQGECEKNRKILEMILQENVTEMVMEPCDEIKKSDYAIDFKGLDADKMLAVILEKQTAYLKRAASSINLSEVKRAFNKMAERKSSLLSEIKN